jgi:Glycogen recognition site of AMP-activated protein kinase
MEDSFKKPEAVKRPAKRQAKKPVPAPLPPEASARVSAAAAAAGAVKPAPAPKPVTTVAAAPVQTPAPKPVAHVVAPAPRPVTPPAAVRKVEMSFDAPLALQVNLAGDFNGWEMTRLALRKTDGLWKITLELKPGTYQYKFLVDGEWVNDPNNVRTVANQFGSLNNVLEVN